MNDWRLREHGDTEELRWWPIIEPRFPNYETLWADHVVPLTFRVVNPDAIFVRPSVPEHLREVATANYSVFWHLAKGHALLQDPGFFEDRRGLFYLLLQRDFDGRLWYPSLVNNLLHLFQDDAL